MSLVTIPLPNLVGGVSQQPPTLRLSTACEDTENTWSSIVTGLNKRPETQWLAKPTISIPNSAQMLILDREDGYQFIAIFTGSTVKVYDFNGVEQTVTYPDGVSYITTSDPRRNIKTLTIGDTSFVLNTSVATGASAVSDAGGRLNPSGRATIHVTQSVSNSYYAIYINNVKVAEYLTPKGVDAASSVPGTDQIAEDLRADLAANGFAVLRNGSTIALSGLNPAHTVQTWTTNGDRAMRCYKDAVNAFNDLPPNELEGRIVKVRGDARDNGDDYYVIFQDGRWIETNAFGSGQTPNPSTMPHKLVRNGDGTWTFSRVTWSARVAGDASSNPPPSFIGQSIKDIYLYNSRLGFVAGENFILSETDVLENFYRTTLATLVDNDVIDFAVFTTGGDVLRHAIPFDKSLLLLADRTQYRVDYQNFLGPRNVQVNFTTTFDVAPYVRPVNMGNSVYFVDDLAGTYRYAKIFEFYTSDNREGDDADEVTKPVPQYIPSGIEFLTGSPRIQCVIANSSATPDSLYVYKYFWTQNQKVQTAWGRWKFPDTERILDAQFSKNYLYMLMSRPDGIHLERILMDEQVYIKDEANPNAVRILLDRKLGETQITRDYDDVSDRTTLTLPWSTAGLVDVVSRYDAPNPDDDLENYRHDVTRINGNTFTVPGNIANHQIVRVGIGYNMKHTMSKPFVKMARGNSEVVNLDTQRIQLRYLKLQYHDTAYFTVHVKYPARTDTVVTFQSTLVGNANSLLGRANILDGVFSVSLAGNNNDLTLEIQNDSPFPCSFGSAEFSGMLTNKIDLRNRM